MRKALAYTSFIITTVLVILAFVTATTYVQLGVAIVLYPLLAFFAYKLFIVNNKVQRISVEPLPAIPVNNSQVETLQKDEIKITDIDKRAFLKLIGATGLSYLLFTLIGRRVGTRFFGNETGLGITSLTDNSGNKINPAESHPTDSYIISEIDDSYNSYYGFINNKGAWYIMKENPENGTFRYARGEENFSGNWAARDTLNYDYYYKVF
jgi:hypothetical protein